ncbi:hypothetical protein L6164_018120 [Bauhinia variegata]|uniref:Uncharacterized protein n=1 Tax=Bauhinia variegata TaxID=167791 RepID=A0ACB9NF01_BAUVA|nr:hypothetical protein L6164_018120 [Bauhinia variegata]
MEDINNWLSFHLNEGINHDFAIRRFCPARMEQEQKEEFQEQEALVDETDLYSSDATSTTPCLASSEVDDFVDSFINMDHYENEDCRSPEKRKSFDHFQDETEAYFMANDNFYGDVPIAMEEEELEIYENVPITMEEEELKFCASVPINVEGEVEEEDINGSFGTLPDLVPTVEDTSLGMDQGLNLVHMLLACAEAVGCRDTQQADSLLRRIWTMVSPCGDPLQRVAYCFAMGLKCRLSLLPHNVFANDALTTSAMDVTRENKLEAFQLLYQRTPYIAFGFMAANEAICQASQGKSSLHIIDLGMEHTLQWPSLIRALASRPEGPPKLRITGLTGDDAELKLQHSMNLLVEEASSLGLSLEFQIISEPVTPSLLTAEKLNLREGKALFVNSIMHLHKYVKESRSYLKAVLQSIKRLNPTLLTVVEQDSNHNGPFFLGRFLESLHYYSAVFDSLEARMPRNSQDRMKIERLHFTGEICNIVAHEGPNRIERHERVDQWRRQLGRAGFQVMELKCTSQARMMLSVYDCDGYTLSSEKGCLLLGWKGRPIMMASAWQVANVS